MQPHTEKRATKWLSSKNIQLNALKPMEANTLIKCADFPEWKLLLLCEKIKRYSQAAIIGDLYPKEQQPRASIEKKKVGRVKGIAHNAAIHNRKGELAMYHDTLNQALIAAGIDPALWPVGCNIGYDETGRVASGGLFISVTRFDCGRYETAISYSTQVDDFCSVVKNNF